MPGARNHSKTLTNAWAKHLKRHCGEHQAQALSSTPQGSEHQCDLASDAAATEQSRCNVSVCTHHPRVHQSPLQPATRCSEISVQTHTLVSEPLPSTLPRASGTGDSSYRTHPQCLSRVVWVRPGPPQCRPDPMLFLCPTHCCCCAQPTLALALHPTPPSQSWRLPSEARVWRSGASQHTLDRTHQH